MLKYLFFILFSGGYLTGAYSQLDTKRVRKLVIDACYSNIDSLLIDPSACEVIPPIPFRVEGTGISWECNDSSSVIGTEVTITYRVLALDLGKPSFFLDTSSLITRETAVYIGYDYSPYQSDRSNNLISSSNLNYSGSLSRGFSVGNSQSLILNSNLNLQLNGDLGNGIRIVAAISDDNIPIQAEGNTQVLQEFDKVFIKVSKDKTDIIAGDYDLQSEGSYFVNYFKKLQGLRLDNSLAVSSDTRVTSRANFAISRGKFARQTLQVREGNQGPYKLTGNNGERFLIILQGSEKVYYDGVLLIRGQDYDYVIDYNNAEILFTPSRLITREARVIVEYEYTDQNYLRSLYAFNSRYETGRYAFNVNFYNEQDSKNATGQIELDSTDITILSGSDGTPGSLLRSGVRMVDPGTISENTILYIQQIDPVSMDTVLVYSKEAVPGVVSAVFSEVGQGRGDYIIDPEAGANGRVYKYTGPGGGAYLPVIQLIAPEKRQMMSLGSSVKLSETAGITGEFSLSNFDDNRFSSIDNSVNQGFAYKLGFERDNSEQESGTWSSAIKAQYEFINRNFTALNPFRPAEFNRDWNISDLPSTREQLASVALNFKRRKSLSAEYAFSLYDRYEQYTGYRHKPAITYRDSLQSIVISWDYLSTSGPREKSKFSRPLIDVSRKFVKLKNWSLRLKYLGESNDRKSAADDVLLPSSFAFDEYYIALESPVRDDAGFSFYGKRRLDRLPLNKAFTGATRINEAGINGRLRSSYSSLSWNLSYRDFNVDLPELVKENNTSTILGRMDYGLQLWEGFLNMVSSYQLGSGQEARREYQFIKVEKGEGTYIYLGDLNSDGEDQINEYEVAVFADQADYIRVNVVNNEFIRTENQGLNASIRLSPDKLLRTKKSFVSDLLSRITTSSIFRFDQKVSSEGNRGLSFLNFNSQDTALVSFTSVMNNTLFFNRGNPVYDLQAGQRNAKNRFVQITGYEARNLSQYFFRSRVNPKTYVDIITELEWGTQEYDSEFFDNKDLDVNLFKINPAINYRPASNLRFTLKYSHETKRQLINEREKAKSHDFSLETTWRQASRSSAVFSLSLVNISFEGEVNTPVAYTLLNGLNRGKNVLWSINLTRRLAGNVDLNINYNGRKPGDLPTVHVARAQVRASF